MNIHEYQGKEILKKFGVAIQRGIVADTLDSAVAAAKELAAETGYKMVCGEITDPCRWTRKGYS